MKAQILSFFVLCSALSVIFASPLQQNVLFNPQPNYDNIPRCLQPKASGLCLAFFPSYYYNPSMKTCEQFIYGGCQGNQNRFLTFDECMKTCEGAEPEEQEFKLIPPSETIDPCSMPSDSGPCRAGIPRFYFNGEKCEELLYGGCEGNKNNFKTIEECQQRCGPKSSEETAGVQPSSENKSEEVVENQSEGLAEKSSEEVTAEKQSSEEVTAEKLSSEEVEKNE